MVECLRERFLLQLNQELLGNLNFLVNNYILNNILNITVHRPLLQHVLVQNQHLIVVLQQSCGHFWVVVGFVVGEARQLARVCSEKPPEDSICKNALHVKSVPLVLAAHRQPAKSIIWCSKCDHLMDENITHLFQVLFDYNTTHRVSQ